MITEQTVFLVVDDADSMRRINSSQLTRLGARQVLLANNGLEALKILEARRVDVIISLSRRIIAIKSMHRQALRWH
mgnify:CR=1 FL=1